jgi:phytoene dehydrogenase-like protein
VKATGPDAVVVGSGPNGLAAALIMARAGLAVQVFEGADTAGGGCRTEEVTLPGFHHDICSAVHPLAAASPFFTSTDLASRGVRLLTPPVAFANPIDGGRAGAVSGSVRDTAAGLGADSGAYRHLLEPLVRDADYILPALLAPLRSIPAHPVAVARFGLEGMLPASRLSRRFTTEEAKALLGGVSAHSFLPLGAPGSGGFGLLLTLIAHSVGWPVRAAARASSTPWSVSSPLSAAR